MQHVQNVELRDYKMLIHVIAVTIYYARIVFLIPKIVTCTLNQIYKIPNQKYGYSSQNIPSQNLFNQGQNPYNFNIPQNPFQTQQQQQFIGQPNFQTGMNYMGHMKNQYKTCNNGHFLEICQRHHHHRDVACDLCGMKNLKKKRFWRCKPCDFAMCFDCYDSSYPIPTNQLKFCNNRHALMRSTNLQIQKKNCKKCNATGFFETYGCNDCNYELCQNCYNNHPTSGEYFY